MCMICIDLDTGKMTYEEAMRNYRELNLQNTDHADELLIKMHQKWFDEELKALETK